jgi:putative membrane protein
LTDAAIAAIDHTSRSDPAVPAEPTLASVATTGDGPDAAAEVESVESQPVETEPDPRFLLANERTFLAWIRTALALIAGGLALAAFLPPFDVPGGGQVIGLPLVVFGGVIALVSYRRLGLNERALRTGQPLLHDRLPAVLAVGVALSAILSLLILGLGGRPG